MSTKDNMQKIVSEVQELLALVDTATIENLIKEIEVADRIYLGGAGRSLLVIKSFAMRLMHLGYQAYMIGETTVPAAEAGDLIIFASGSGETGALKTMAAKAKEIGATIALITYRPQSTIAKLADLVLEIPVETIKDRFQPTGSSFEQSMLILFDAIFLSIYQGQKQNLNIDEFIKLRHANLE